MTQLLSDSFDLQIESVPVKRLAEFSRTAQADPERYGVLPIDPIRAAAQALNPIADDNDPGLMVAYSDNRCIGHQGLIPISISIDGKISKMIATVALFIHSDFRGRRTTDGLTVAETIYRQSLDLGFDVMNTGFGKPRQRLHERRPEWFVQLPSLQFCQVRLSPFQPISALVKRVSKRKGAESFGRTILKPLKIIDKVTTPLFTKFLTPGTIGHREFRIENADQVVEIEPAPPASSLPIYFPRSIAIVNWMIRNVWHPIGNNPYPRCYFCNARQRFEYQAYNILDEQDNRHGFFVLSLATDDHYSTLRILDYQAVNKSTESVILRFAFWIALREQVNMLECSMKFSQHLQSNRLLNRMTAVAERPYWLGLQDRSPLRGRLSEIELNYCDGERPFL